MKLYFQSFNLKMLHFVVILWIDSQARVLASNLLQESRCDNHVFLQSFDLSIVLKFRIYNELVLHDHYGIMIVDFPSPPTSDEANRWDWFDFLSCAHWLTLVRSVSFKPELISPWWFLGLNDSVCVIKLTYIPPVSESPFFTHVDYHIACFLKIRQTQGHQYPNTLIWKLGELKCMVGHARSRWQKFLFGIDQEIGNRVKWFPFTNIC